MTEEPAGDEDLWYHALPTKLLSVLPKHPSRSEGMTEEPAGDEDLWYHALCVGSVVFKIWRFSYFEIFVKRCFLTGAVFSPVIFFQWWYFFSGDIFSRWCFFSGGVFSQWCFFPVVFFRAEIFKTYVLALFWEKRALKRPRTHEFFESWAMGRLFDTAEN
jgi:hypothetical protein